MERNIDAARVLSEMSALLAAPPPPPPPVPDAPLSPEAPAPPLPVPAPGPEAGEPAGQLEGVHHFGLQSRPALICPVRSAGCAPGSVNACSLCSHGYSLLVPASRLKTVGHKLLNGTQDQLAQLAESCDPGLKAVNRWARLPGVRHFKCRFARRKSKLPHSRKSPRPGAWPMVQDSRPAELVTGNRASDKERGVCNTRPPRKRM